MNHCAYCFELVNQEEHLTCNGMCRQRFHPRCVNWSPLEYNAYKSISSKIKWFCTACDEAIEEISSMYSESTIKSVKPKYEYKTQAFVEKPIIPQVHRNSRSKSPVKMSDYGGIPKSIEETAQHRPRSNQIESKIHQIEEWPPFLPPTNTANIQEETAQHRPRSNQIESKIHQIEECPPFLPPTNTANIQEEMAQTSCFREYFSPSKRSSSYESVSKGSTGSPKSICSTIGTNTDDQRHLNTENINPQQALLEQKTERDIKLISNDLENTKTQLFKSLMVRIELEKQRIDDEENKLKLLKASLAVEMTPPGPSRKVKGSSSSPERKSPPSRVSTSPVNSERMNPIMQSLQDGRRSLTHSPQRTIVDKQIVTANKKSFLANKTSFLTKKNRKAYND